MDRHHTLKPVQGPGLHFTQHTNTHANEISGAASVSARLASLTVTVTVAVAAPAWPVPVRFSQRAAGLLVSLFSIEEPWYFPVMFFYISYLCFFIKLQCSNK